MNRRDFMKGAAVGVAAGPQMAQQAVSSMRASPIVANGGGYYSGEYPGGFGPPVLDSPEVTAIRRKIDAAHSAMQYVRDDFPMPLDLLEMRSTSRAWRMSVIRGREKEQQTIIESLKEQLRKLVSAA